MMNDSICKYLFFLLLKYGKVSEEKKDIYLYGIEILLEKAENLFFIFIITLIYRRWIEGILFVVIYSILRKTGGGYHSKTSSGCILFTIAIVNIFFLLLHTTILIPLMRLFMILFAACIYIIAPVDCYNNPLDGPISKKNLLLTLIIVICIFGIMSVLSKDIAKAIYYIVNIYLVVLIMGIKDSPRYRERKKND